jgi:hypothetical protein
MAPINPVMVLFLILLGGITLILMCWMFLTIITGVINADDEESTELVPNQKCDCPDPDHCKNCR